MAIARTSCIALAAPDFSGRKQYCKEEGGHCPLEVGLFASNCSRTALQTMTWRNGHKWYLSVHFDSRHLGGAFASSVEPNRPGVVGKTHSMGFVLQLTHETERSHLRPFSTSLNWACRRARGGSCPLGQARSPGSFLWACLSLRGQAGCGYLQAPTRRGREFVLVPFLLGFPA